MIIDHRVRLGRSWCRLPWERRLQREERRRRFGGSFAVALVVGAGGFGDERAVAFGRRAWHWPRHDRVWFERRGRRCCCGGRRLFCRRGGVLRHDGCYGSLMVACIHSGDRRIDSAIPAIYHCAILAMVG